MLESGLSHSLVAKLLQDSSLAYMYVNFVLQTKNAGTIIAVFVSSADLLSIHYATI